MRSRRKSGYLTDFGLGGDCPAGRAPPRPGLASLKSWGGQNLLIQDENKSIRRWTVRLFSTIEFAIAPAPAARRRQRKQPSEGTTTPTCGCRAVVLRVFPPRRCQCWSKVVWILMEWLTQHFLLANCELMVPGRARSVPFRALRGSAFPNLPHHKSWMHGQSHTWNSPNGYCVQPSTCAGQLQAWQSSPREATSSRTRHPGC